VDHAEADQAEALKEARVAAEVKEMAEDGQAQLAISQVADEVINNI
tara:strand:+ start:554 stop:691 length:138 start_codon:yes stop_codon:yes gene_type:complete